LSTGTTRHVGMLLRGVECHKLPNGVWGEAPAGPAAKVYFCFFLRNETHSRTKKIELLLDLWLDEPRAKILGMRD